MINNITNADNVRKDVADISGVKETDAFAPEHSADGPCRDAGGKKEDEKNLVKEKELCVFSIGQTSPGERTEECGTSDVAVLSAESLKDAGSARDTDVAEREDREFLDLIKGKYREAYRRRTESIIRRRLKSTRGKPSDMGEVSLDKGKTGAERAASGVSEAGKTVEGLSEKSVSGDAVPQGKASVSVVSQGAEDNAAVLETVAHSEAPQGAVLTDTETFGAVAAGSAVKATAVKSSILDDAEKQIRQIRAQISANQSRPRENGVGGSVGMYTGINVSALKGSDVLALLRRAEAGEKIKFN